LNREIRTDFRPRPKKTGRKRPLGFENGLRGRTPPLAGEIGRLRFHGFLETSGNRQLKTSNTIPILFLLGLLFSGGRAGAEPVPARHPAASTPKEKPSVLLRLAYVDLDCDFCRRFVFSLHEEAFRRMGLRVAFVELPGERALIQSNAGELDGEALRIADFDAENQYSNLIRVPEPLMEIPVVAYTAHSPPLVYRWESLREGSFFIAGPAQIKWIQTRLAQWVDAKRIIPAHDPVHAVRLLLSKRAGVVVSIPALMAETLSLPKFRDRGVRPAGVLETVTTYASLHKRHGRLSLRLARTIREMKADGTLAKMKTEALSDEPNLDALLHRPAAPPRP
jgi:hypothetical protein